MEKLFLGIDCGLTSIKAVVFDRFGKLHRASSKKNSVVDGMIDTRLLWEKVVFCIKQSVNGIEKQIAGISVCGHGNGLYFAVNGVPYEFGYSSMYNGATISDERISDITLQTVWAGQPLNILRRIKNENEELYRSISGIFFCKDYIRFMLTGVFATDYSDATAAGLTNNNDYRIDPRLFSLFGLNGAEKLIPKIYDSYENIGGTTEEIENLTGIKSGTPVAVGAFDVCGCIVGSGVKDESEYSIISGTWGINGALSKMKINDRRITQCCSFVDRTFNLCIESSPTSCVNLEWLINNVCPYVDYGEILDITKMRTDLIYLPYIYPSMRYPDRKAEFVNLCISHTYKDMVKAVLDGIVFGHRLQIEALKSVGLERNGAVLSGGAANSSGWCQLFADILNTEIKTTEEKECGALGAAIFAAVASGEYGDIYSAQNEMVRYKETFVPKNDYENEYKKFLEVLRRKNGSETKR